MFSIFSTKEKQIIICIVFLSLIVKLTILFNNPSYKQVIYGRETDGVFYYDISTQLVSGNGFSNIIDGKLRPIVRIAPGYPIFIAGIRLIFGDNPVVVRIVQILLSTLTAIVISKIGIIVFNKITGLIGLIIFLFYPIFIDYSLRILTETFVIFLLVLFLFYIVKYIKQKRIKYLVFSGVILSLATSVRTFTMLFPLFIMTYFVFTSTSTKTYFKKVIIFLLAFSIPFIPWTLRNYNITGKLIPTGQGGGGNLFVGNYLPYHGNYDSKYFDEEPLSSILKGVNKEDPERDFILQKAAKKVIKNNIENHPYEYFKLLFVTKPIKLWGTTQGGVFGYHNRFKVDIKQRNYKAIIVKSVCLLVYFLLLLSAIYGFFYKLKKNWRYIIIIAGFPLYLTLVHLPLLCCTRYAVPSYPFIFILSAYGIYAFLQKILRKSRAFR